MSAIRLVDAAAVAVRVLPAVLLLGCARAVPLPDATPGACGRPPLFNGVIDRREVVFYDVDGATAEEIEEHLRRAQLDVAPDPVDGAAIAMTGGSSCIATSVLFNDGACALFAIRVDARIRITLPRWRAPASADPALRAWWDARLARLVAHEEVHRAIDLAGLRRFAARAARVPAAPTCGELQARIETVYREEAAITAAAHGAFHKRERELSKR